MPKLRMTKVPTKDLESLRDFIDLIGPLYHKDECGPPEVPQRTRQSYADELRAKQWAAHLAPTWQSADGQRHRISDMITSHITNTLRFLIRRADQHLNSLENRECANGLSTSQLKALFYSQRYPGDTEDWLRKHNPSFVALAAELHRRTNPSTSYIGDYA